MVSRYLLNMAVVVVLLYICFGAEEVSSMDSLLLGHKSNRTFPPPTSKTFRAITKRSELHPITREEYKFDFPGPAIPNIVLHSRKQRVKRDGSGVLKATEIRAHNVKTNKIFAKQVETDIVKAEQVNSIILSIGKAFSLTKTRTPNGDPDTFIINRDGPDPTDTKVILVLERSNEPFSINGHRNHKKEKRKLLKMRNSLAKSRQVKDLKDNQLSNLGSKKNWTRQHMTGVNSSEVDRSKSATDLQVKQGERINTSGKESNGNVFQSYSTSLLNSVDNSLTFKKSQIDKISKTLSKGSTMQHRNAKQRGLSETISNYYDGRQKTHHGTNLTKSIDIEHKSASSVKITDSKHNSLASDINRPVPINQSIKKGKSKNIERKSGTIATHVYSMLISKKENMTKSKTVTYSQTVNKKHRNVIFKDPTHMGKKKTSQQHKDEAANSSTKLETQSQDKLNIRKQVKESQTSPVSRTKLRYIDKASNKSSKVKNRNKENYTKITKLASKRQTGYDYYSDQNSENELNKRKIQKPKQELLDSRVHHKLNIYDESQSYEHEDESSEYQEISKANQNKHKGHNSAMPVTLIIKRYDNKGIHQQIKEQKTSNGRKGSKSLYGYSLEYVSADKENDEDDDLYRPIHNKENMIGNNIASNAISDGKKGSRQIKHDSKDHFLRNNDTIEVSDMKRTFPKKNDEEVKSNIKEKVKTFASASSSSKTPTISNNLKSTPMIDEIGREKAIESANGIDKDYSFYTDYLDEYYYNFDSDYS